MKAKRVRGIEPHARHRMLPSHERLIKPKPIREFSSFQIFPVPTVGQLWTTDPVALNYWCALLCGARGLCSLSQQIAMMVRRVSSKHECILARPQREDRRVGKKGRPHGRDARRFGVHRATVTRYCKQLDERGTLEPRKAPGKAPKLDEKARRLLLVNLQHRPWATHSQRAQFLFAACEVSVSEATVCQTLRRLSHSRKKGPQGR